MQMGWDRFLFKRRTMGTEEKRPNLFPITMALFLSRFHPLSRLDLWTSLLIHLLN